MAKLLHIFYHKEGTFSLLCQQVQYFAHPFPIPELVPVINTFTFYLLLYKFSF